MKASLLGLLLVLCISTSITENHESAEDHTITLSLDYAARQGQPLRTSQFAVVWNGKTVKAVAPSNYGVTHLSLELEAKAGKNVISFAGLGPSDGYGATITNVKLVRPHGCEADNEDLISNGNFHKGHSLGSGWKIFKDGIGGWQGKDIEIGHGPIYNSGWKRGSYVCELDAAGNSNTLRQSIYLD